MWNEVYHIIELLLAAGAIIITLRSNYRASNKQQEDSIIGRLNTISEKQDERHMDNLKVQGEIKVDVRETAVRVTNIERHVFGDIK